MKKLLATMLLLTLTSISSVFAEDNNDNTNSTNTEVNTTSTEVNTSTTTNDNIPKGGPKTLPVYNNDKTNSIRNKIQKKVGNGVKSYRITREKIRNKIKERNKNREEMRMKIKNHREEIKNNKEEMRKNREEMKKNREEMRKNGDLKQGFKNLDENTKNELKSTYENYKTEIKKLRDDYKANRNDEAKVADIRNKMETLRQDNYTKVKSIVGSNTGVLNKIKQKEAVFKKNLKLRKKNVIARKTLRGDRATFISKYKKSFNNRLKNVIDRIPDSKLQMVADRIDSYITKIENSTRLSDTKKNNIMDQVLALKEIIDEKISASTATTDVIDIKSLLTF